MIHLANAEERNQKHPTFSIPPEKDRRHVAVGDACKLVFLPPESAAMPGRAERMWVRVTEVSAEGYSGKLCNHPAVLDVPFGAEVSFGPEHIIAIRT